MVGDCRPAGNRRSRDHSLRFRAAGFAARRLDCSHDSRRPCAEVRIQARTWNVLKVSFRKARFEVYFDHRKVFEVEDDTFSGPGKVGLWTKADSVTYFDDFQFAGK